MDINGILEKIGYWGLYQKRLCVLLTLSTIPNGILVMLMVFTHETPPHRCYIPDIDNVTDAGFIAGASTPSFNETMLLPYIPLEKMDGKIGLSRCNMYTSHQRYPVANTTVAKENLVSGCKYGWVYDIAPGRATIITMWDIVCEQAWIKPLATSAYMIGAVVAAFVAGYISDRYGRKQTFFWSTVLQGIAALLCATSVNVPMYIVCLVICGGFGFTNMAAAVVLAAEIMHPKMRGIVGNLEMIGFCVGYMILPLIAYLTLTWRHIYYVLASTAVLVIPYWWLLFESPRWLVLRNKPEEAKEVLRKMAKVNGTWDDRMEECFAESKDKEVEEEDSTTRSVQYTFADIVRYPVTRKRIVIFSYCWTIVNMVYYFVSYSSSNLGGNKYVNCLIAAAIEFPAAVLSMFILDWFGRVLSCVTLMALSAVACLIVPFLLDVSPAATITTAMIGKFAMTAVFDILFIYTPETVPTLMRNKALGVVTCLGRIGGISAPYMIYWSENGSTFPPYILMTVLTVVAALSFLLLPETRNVTVPATMEDAGKQKTILQRHGCQIFPRRKISG